MSTKRKPELYKAVPSEWSDFFDIYDEAVETAPPGSALVEVGSFWGKSAIYLAEAAKIADKGLRVYCIDTWTMTPANNPSLFDPEHGARGHIEPVVHARYNNNLFETFAHFVSESGLSPDPLRIMRMDTFEAAQMFTAMTNCNPSAWEQRIHFVFLDNDHEYEHVIREIPAWLRCSPTIIAGHDYTEEFDGVRRAVDQYWPKTADRHADKAQIQGKSWIVRLRV